MIVEPMALVGQTLVGLTTQWHEHGDERSTVPVHVWLHLDGLPTVRLHTLNGLQLSTDEVDRSCDLGPYGRLVTEPGGPDGLAERLGESVRSVARLVQTPPRCDVGVVLHLTAGSVGIADLGDDLVIATWPSPDWARWGVAVAAE